MLSRINRSLFVFICLSVLLVSCNKPKLFEAITEIPEGLWNIDNRPSFEVVVEDTLMPYNFYLLLRNTAHYPFSNIFLFMESEFPNQAIRKDTIECLLSDPQGKWLGSGLGDMVDNKILFKRNVIFPKAGTYKFSFQHAMRIENVGEITDVGLLIEAAK